MEKLKELDDLMKMDFNSDAWADACVDMARVIVNQLNEAEWEMLTKIWKEREDIWKFRLVDALGSSNPNASIRILEEMVKSSRDDEFTFHALDKLEAMDDIYFPDNDMIEWLKRKNQEGLDRYQRKSIQTLIARKKDHSV